MWRYWLVWLSLLQPIWTATFPSEDYNKQHPETEIEFDVMPPKPQSSQDVSDVGQAVADQQADNLSELLFQDGHQSDSLFENQETITTDTYSLPEEYKINTAMFPEKYSTETAGQENNVPSYSTSETFLSSSINPATDSVSQETTVQDRNSRKSATNSPTERPTDTETAAQEVPTTELTFQTPHIVQTERSDQHGDVVQTTIKADIGEQDVKETARPIMAESNNIEVMWNNEPGVGSTTVFPDEFTTLSRNCSESTVYSTAVDERKPSEAISSGDFNNFRESREEKYGFINNIPENISTSSYQNISQTSTKSNEVFSATLGSGEVQTRSDEQKVTESTEIDKSELFYSTADGNIEANSNISNTHKLPMVTTTVNKNAGNETKTDTEPIANISKSTIQPRFSIEISQNTGDFSTQNRPDEDQFTTSIENSESDGKTVYVDQEKVATTQNVNLNDSTTVVGQKDVTVSTTSFELNEFRNRLTTTTEQSITNEAIFRITRDQTKHSSVETIKPEEDLTLSAEEQTTTTPTRENTKKIIHTNEPFQPHSTEQPCSHNEACASQTEGCVCVSTSAWNNLHNNRLCPSINEVTTPINEKSFNTTTWKNNTHSCNISQVLSMQEFFTRKWKQLNSTEKQYRTTSISFSPVHEVIEWFQFYDWNFRKYISSIVTKCMLRKHLNESSNHWEVTPSHIVYVLPTPLLEDSVITLSFLVQHPRMPKNSSWFVENQLIVPCLQEKQKPIQIEVKLTVKKVSAGFPTGMLNECNFAGACLSERRVMFLLIGLVVVLSVVTLVAMLFAVKRRQPTSRYNGRPLYTARDLRQLIAQPHPNVLRSPGDGHNLASDEQCQQGEGRRRDPENGDLLGKEDSDGWVVPLEEVEAMKREEKTRNEEDSKV